MSAVLSNLRSNDVSYNRNENNHRQRHEHLQHIIEFMAVRTLKKINETLGHQHSDTVGWVSVRAFIRSFWAGAQPTPVHRLSAGRVRLPLGERKGIGWCVQCVRDMQERQVK